MWTLIYPIILIVLSNVIYNICTKSTSGEANSFASLTITYGIAALFCFVLFFVTSKKKDFFSEISKMNWSSFVLGIVIVGLELGYILAYRNGWQMNKVSVTANIILAVILVLVAAVFYKEHITLKQVIGIIVCAGGLALISL